MQKGLSCTVIHELVPDIPIISCHGHDDLLYYADKLRGQPGIPRTLHGHISTCNAGDYLAWLQLPCAGLPNSLEHCLGHYDHGLELLVVAAARDILEAPALVQRRPLRARMYVTVFQFLA